MYKDEKDMTDIIDEVGVENAKRVLNITGEELLVRVVFGFRQEELKKLINHLNKGTNTERCIGNKK